MLVSFAVLGLFGQVALALVVGGPIEFRCGAPEPSEQQLQTAKQMTLQEQAEAALSRSGPKKGFEVDTVFHVVSVSNNSADGYLSDETLAKQLDVLNQDYAPSNVSFKLVNTTRTINTSWANNLAEEEMKNALRIGGYSTLNIYFLSSLGGGLLGYCYFPTDTAPGEQDFVLDGCTILADSVPGGPAAPFDLGRTATHEVGHWMGLFHTFQGGCFGSGDGISDTPAQSSASRGCPIGRDSCPSSEGLDPIHNYMDYSDDACYEEFTPLQSVRMRTSWDEYRVGH